MKLSSRNRKILGFVAITSFAGSSCLFGCTTLYCQWQKKSILGFNPVHLMSLFISTFIASVCLSIFQLEINSVLEDKRLVEIEKQAQENYREEERKYYVNESLKFGKKTENMGARTL